jgi:O-antigen/teichoic acid export membrane protein
MTTDHKKSGSRLRQWFSDGIVSRVYKNASVLLGGKFVAALLSIAYIPLATHALGATLFGVLVLVNAYTRAMAATFAFQVRLTLIRYATIHLHDKSPQKLKKLFFFLLLVEVGFGILAIILTALLVPVVGVHFSWPTESYPVIMVYSFACVSLMFSMPAGVLFVYGRFKLLSIQQTVGPAVRLICAIAAFVLEAGLNGFILAWLAGSLAEAGMQWFFGLRELSRQGLMNGLVQWPRGVTRENDGVWRFLLATKVDTSLEDLSSRATPLAVGWVLGPAAAGLYQVALKIGMVLTQPMMLIGQALYPELSNLVVSKQHKSLNRVVLRTGLIAISLGILVLIVLSVFGQQILVLFGGSGFEAAYGVLVLVALAATIQFFGFPMSSALVASGKPGTVLKIKLISSALLFPALLGLLKLFGLIGAGYYATIFALTIVISLAVAFKKNMTLSKRDQSR